MTLKELKKANRIWNGNYGYASEQEWERNFQIVRKAEELFYAHYDKECMQPQRGDIIEFVNNNELYPHAQVESVDRFGLMYVCENGSTWTDGEHFSTSGGAFTHIHRSKFEFVGYEERLYWTWGCYGPGANQGIYFRIKVKKFRQKEMVIEPLHNVIFNSRYWKERRGSKVVIMKDCQYIFKEFKTIKEFKEWAAYTGFTYRKNFYSARYYSNQFLNEKLFWKLKELPEGCKPIEDYSNGRKVKCYVHNDGQTLTIYRPNPNAKEVYVPMD